MKTLLDIFEWAASSRRLSWPILFVLGALAGSLLGFATGLPTTGRVVAGVAPLESVMPDAAPDALTQFETASRVTIAPLATERVTDPVSPPPPARSAIAVAISDAPQDTPRVDVAIDVEAAETPQLPSMDTPTRPRIALVIDDLGLDRAAFDRINAFPGPLTLAFLPYGTDAQGMIDVVRDEHEVILHLPMEPETNKADAGPDYLRAGASADEIRAGLFTNLSRLSGYVGVNNHTGSAFTTDPVAMEIVLRTLDRKGLFFLDSVTTPSRVARDIAAAEGFRVRERDVFLDGEWPAVTTGSIKDQIAQLEAIAKERGYAIGIAHPYLDTLETLGPWLVTIEARGFDLVPLSSLMPEPHRPETLARLR